MGISAEIDWIILHLLDDLSQLVLLAGLSDLLGQVVAKGVVHQVHVVVNCEHKDLIYDFLFPFFNLLLQKSAATLISSKGIGVFQQGLHFLHVEFLMTLQCLKC